MNKRMKIFKWISLLTVAIFIGITGCDKFSLNADAGPDQMAGVGETVTLDGSNSSAPAATLAFIWVISSQPAGSVAVLSDATTATPSFVPQVAGDYVISLTVTDGAGEDSDEVTVTVTEGGGSGAITVSGNIDNDITWTDHLDSPTTPDYHLTGDVYLNAELTIEPGVLIHVDEDVVLDVTEDGALMASGESGNMITFTGANISGSQLWKGIRVASTDSRNELAYVDLSYAGNSEFGGFANFVDLRATVAVMNGGVISITNSSITNSGGYGVYVRYGKLNSFADNAFENNAENAVGVDIQQATMIDANTTFTGNDNDVEIFGSTLESSAELNLTKLNGSAKYLVTGDIILKSYLSFDPGTYLEIDDDVEIRVDEGGVIIADGDADNLITFTSSGVNSGLKWKGLSIWSADARNLLSYVEILHAGSSEFGSFANFVDLQTNIAILEGGRIAIDNSIVSDGAGYGLYMRYGDILAFSSNTFMNNEMHAIGLEANQAMIIDENTSFSGNGYDGVEVFGSDLTDESTWVELSGTARYHITGTMDLLAGLNLDPGVDIEIDEDQFFKVLENGYLSALGNSGNRITFNTSNEAGELYWGGLWFESADARNELDYVNVSYAGGAEMDLDNFQDPFTAVGGDELAKISITNSIIDNSDGSGVYWQGAGTINDIESGGANNAFNNNSGANVY